MPDIKSRKDSAEFPKWRFLSVLQPEILHTCESDCFIPTELKVKGRIHSRLVGVYAVRCIGC